jgi:hypothetical protein
VRKIDECREIRNIKEVSGESQVLVLVGCFLRGFGSKNQALTALYSSWVFLNI